MTSFSASSGAPPVERQPPAGAARPRESRDPRRAAFDPLRGGGVAAAGRAARPDRAAPACRERARPRRSARQAGRVRARQARPRPRISTARRGRGGRPSRGARRPAGRRCRRDRPRPSARKSSARRSAGKAAPLRVPAPARSGTRARALRRGGAGQGLPGEAREPGHEAAAPRGGGWRAGFRHRSRSRGRSRSTAGVPTGSTAYSAIVPALPVEAACGASSGAIRVTAWPSSRGAGRRTVPMIPAPMTATSAMSVAGARSTTMQQRLALQAAAHVLGDDAGGGFGAGFGGDMRGDGDARMGPEGWSGAAAQPGRHRAWRGRPGPRRARPAARRRRSACRGRD
jgi:hypothetical protein